MNEGGGFALDFSLVILGMFVVSIVIGKLLSYGSCARCPSPAHKDAGGTPASRGGRVVPLPEPRPSRSFDGDAAA